MEEPGTGTDLLAEARLALDRAHRAARSLEGGEFRRALEEACDVLQALGKQPDTADLAGSARNKVVKALDDLEAGPLDEAENLVEQARLDLAAGAPG